MIIDARSVSSGTVIETEVCIVGAGVAGIMLAREFSGSPFRVALLENDGMAYEQDTQDFYEAQSIGLPLENSRVSRLRFFSAARRTTGAIHPKSGGLFGAAPGRRGLEFQVVRRVG